MTQDNCGLILRGLCYLLFAVICCSLLFVSPSVGWAEGEYPCPSQTAIGFDGHISFGPSYKVVLASRARLFRHPAQVAQSQWGHRFQESLCLPKESR